MAKFRVTKPLADGASEAAAKVGATAKAGSAKVGQRAQTLGDYLLEQRRGPSCRCGSSLTRPGCPTRT